MAVVAICTLSKRGAVFDKSLEQNSCWDIAMVALPCSRVGLVGSILSRQDRSTKGLRVRSPWNLWILFLICCRGCLRFGRTELRLAGSTVCALCIRTGPEVYHHCINCDAKYMAKSTTRSCASNAAVPYVPQAGLDCSYQGCGSSRPETRRGTTIMRGGQCAGTPTDRLNLLHPGARPCLLISYRLLLVLPNSYPI